MALILIEVTWKSRAELNIRRGFWEDNEKEEN